MRLKIDGESQTRKYRIARTQINLGQSHQKRYAWTHCIHAMTNKGTGVATKMWASDKPSGSYYGVYEFICMKLASWVMVLRPYKVSTTTLITWRFTKMLKITNRFTQLTYYILYTVQIGPHPAFKKPHRETVATIIHLKNNNNLWKSATKLLINRLSILPQRTLHSQSFNHRLIPTDAVRYW
jgi:hypothetical protein